MTAPAPAPLDADDFRRLVETHAAELTRYACGILSGDGDSARDIIQDTFVKLWQSPPADRSHLRAWLFCVCRSRCLDMLRRRGRIVGDDGSRAEHEPDEAPSPARALADSDAAGALFALVDTLAPRQREIVRLKFQNDLSYAEIAEITGLTATNVGFILHTAIKTLRARLDERSDLRE